MFGNVEINGIDKPHPVARRPRSCYHSSLPFALFAISNPNRQQLVIGNLQFGRKLHVPFTPDGVLSLDRCAVDIARKIGLLCGRQRAQAAVNRQLQA